MRDAEGGRVAELREEVLQLREQLRAAAMGDRDCDAGRGRDAATAEADVAGPADRPESLVQRFRQHFGAVAAQIDDAWFDAPTTRAAVEAVVCAKTAEPSYDMVLVQLIVAVQHWLDRDTARSAHHAAQSWELFKACQRGAPQTPTTLSVLILLSLMAYAHNEIERFMEARHLAERCAAVLEADGVCERTCGCTGRPCRLVGWQGPTGNEVFVDAVGMASAAVLASTSNHRISPLRVHTLLQAMDTARHWIEEQMPRGPLWDAHRSALMGAAGLLLVRHSHAGTMDRRLAEERMRLAMEAAATAHATLTAPVIGGLYVAIGAYWVRNRRDREWQRAREVLLGLVQQPAVREGVALLDAVRAARQQT